MGTWVGEGEGFFPTISDFRYTEEVRFWHVGKPMLLYSQKTSHADDGRPLHAEMGFWRPAGPGQVELVVAHPTGHTEVASGRVSDGHIELRCAEVGASATAKDVTEVERVFDQRGDELRYTLRMAAVGHPVREHLRATLRRQDR